MDHWFLLLVGEPLFANMHLPCPEPSTKHTRKTDENTSKNVEYVQAPQSLCLQVESN